MRLIQEDHFKGVADVRLRINFHQQLQALEDADRYVQDLNDSFTNPSGHPVPKLAEPAAEPEPELPAGQAAARSGNPD